MVPHRPTSKTAAAERRPAPGVALAGVRLSRMPSGLRKGWIALGTACFVLALLGLQLNRSNLKQAAELERKVALLEGK